MTKITFDEETHTFSTDYDFSGKNTIEFVDGRENITIGQGTLPANKDIRNFKASGKFHTKNDITCQNVDVSGMWRLGNVRCTNFRGTGKGRADSVSCKDFYMCGKMNCMSVVADKVVMSQRPGGEIGSMTAKSVEIGANYKDVKAKHPILAWIAEKITDNKTLYIHNLTCDTAVIDGDVTIGALKCKGKCTVLGDKVKILKEEK